MMASNEIIETNGKKADLFNPPTIRTTSELSESKMPVIEIRASPFKEELFRVDRLLFNKEFFSRHGYKPRLPSEEIQKGIEARRHPVELKWRVATGLDIDSAFKRKLDEEKFYDEKYFEAGITVLEKQRCEIEKAFPIFFELQEKWGFKVFPKYVITLTKYGPGGLYNIEDDAGRVILYITQDGRFSNQNPIRTIIHEMVHLGIEKNIIQKFLLTHQEKERIVDLICTTQFGKFLPDYQFQKVGDPRIDPYVTAETINHLPSSISDYIQQYPRLSHAQQK